MLELIVSSVYSETKGESKTFLCSSVSDACGQMTSSDVELVLNCNRAKHL